MIIEDMREELANIDYTIYDINSDIHYEPRDEGILEEAITYLSNYTKECDYKYYKKLKIINYCECSKCLNEWFWPKHEELLVPEVTVAANPKTFEVGTHIKTNHNKFLVCFNDESIPVDTIYVYVKNHDRDNSSLLYGIWDVYKEK